MSDQDKNIEPNNDTKRSLRLVKLYELLNVETNKENPLSTNKILEKLKESGCPCVRQTLKTDIDSLISGGYPIVETNVGHANGYYMDSQLFSTAELRLMIDAVYASRIIPKEKADLLADKISQINGNCYKEALKDSVFYLNTPKHTNESIWLNIEAASNAILQNRRLRFYYFLLNENHQKKYKHNKKRYNVTPLKTVYMNDYYYLICCDDDHEGLVNYRLDRMELVEVSKKPASEQAAILRPEIPAYVDSIFKMYAGREEIVTLEFSEDLIKVIYDKFGEDTPITRIQPATKIRAGICQATLTVQVSPTFWGWLFQFGTQMKVIAPNNVIEEFQQKLAQLLQQ